MLRRGVFVVCVALAACGKGKQDDARKLPPGAGRVAPSVVIDAAVATSPGTVDAPVAATMFTITDGAVGPMAQYRGTPGDDDASLAELRALFPGLDVELGTMQGARGERTYYGVRDGDEELLQITPGPGAVLTHVLSPRFTTQDGLKVGDTLPDVAAKRPAVACQVVDGDPIGRITCRSPDAPEVVFVLQASCWKEPPPPEGAPADPLKLGPCKIIEIVR